MRHGQIKLEGNIDANSKSITDPANLITSNESTRTVNFNSGMNTATIQALIDAEDKHIGDNHTLTFQFADGTYTLSQITFAGFFGNGTINIQGNVAEIGQRTDQSVIINQSVNGIRLRGVRVDVCSIKSIRFNIDQSVAGYQGVSAEYCTKITTVSCYLNGNSITKGYGVFYNDVGHGAVSNCLFTQSIFAIFFQNSWGGSISNDDTGTLPAYGLQSEGGTL